MIKILIIDDERATLDMLGLFLEAYGYRVLTAENGEKGIEVFRSERPEIVMTDIKMPGMGGFDVLRNLKAIDPQTEVIVFTGHGDMELAIQALNLNATDFINKPLEKRHLEAALKRAEERLSSCRQGACHVNYKIEGDVMVLEINGNLTSRSEGPLKEVISFINKTACKKVVFCLDENASINGAGIALLTQLVFEGAERGQKMLLTGVTKNFERVFSMVGITRVAPIVTDRETALSVFRAS